VIKKQYKRGAPGYFNNFINSHDPEYNVEEHLKPYDATLAKSKNKNYRLNVKWHNERMYMMFVLRYS
jgi:hypothetical protein